MAAKPWREVVTPHRDIREGHFDESTFAADLADVLADRGPLEYRDPQTFFRKTYPTEGIVRLLSVVLARLAGKGRGEPVIQIQTPFGGGKTHSLVALYHLFTSGAEHTDLELVKRVLKEAKAKTIPKAQVAVFVGTAADPLKGKTPWGTLAEQLGRYKLLHDHDEARRTPGKDLLHTLLGEEPTLILMDEVAQYVAKCIDPKGLEESGARLGRAYQTQVLTFLQELSETVKVLPQAALVVTLPSSAPYGEEGERALQELQKLFGRLEAVYEPVRGEEIYEVIRKRLFEDLGDPQEAKRAADAYWELYRSLEKELPDGVREPSYREKMRRAYPFHPELIDLLFERWSTLPTFQRTRGVLRLLAEVVSDLYRREHAAPLIQPAHVNLANPDITRELVKHIGPEFNAVIATDIADTTAKAQRIDRQMGSEYKHLGVASGLATAIFLYSFSGGERKGASIPQLRLSLLREGIPSPFVGDALHYLEEELWYLHVESGVYQFTSQPNLNRIIIEREEAITEELIQQEIRERLEQLAGREMKVYLYPTASGDVPDSKELKLAVLAPELPEQSTESFINELLEKAGSSFRVYKNTLVVLAPDSTELAELRRMVKRYLALNSIKSDKSVTSRLSQEDKNTLEAKLKDTNTRVDERLISCYRRLKKAGDRESANLGLPTTGIKYTLAKRVREYLQSQELLLDRISPRRLLEVLGEHEEKPISEIYEAFLRYPHLPLVESQRVVEQAAAQGVREGEFALRCGEQLYCAQEPPPSLEDALLVRTERVFPPSHKEEEKSLERTESKEGEAKGQKPIRHSLKMRIRLPWNKLSDFTRGVIMPLHQEGAELEELEVHLRAHSSKGIPESTVEQKVKETLRQIGAPFEMEE